MPPLGSLIAEPSLLAEASMLSKMSISFNPDATIIERVAKVAPVLNDVLMQLEDGRLAEVVGVEKFDEEL